MNVARSENVSGSVRTDYNSLSLLPKINREFWGKQLYGYFELPDDSENWVSVGFEPPYKVFNFLHARYDSILITDIARSLSMKGRWGNFTPKFYSIAEHCVFGSHMLKEPVNALQFLLHDAAEYIMGDLLSPIKRVCHVYDIIEDKLLQRILVKYIGSDYVSESVKQVDKLMSIAERKIVRGENFTVDYRCPQELPCWEPEYAELAYLDRFMELITQLWGQDAE